MKFEPLKQVKRTILLDTDIGPDCDDVGALALLHALARQYGIRVAAICNCTSNPYGCGAIDVINRYFGAADIPIGITGRRSFWDKPDTQYYNRLLCEKFGTPYEPIGTKKAEDAVSLYKRVLLEAEDDSILFITIGMLNNIAELLDAAPELVNRKVHAFITMAGREYNCQKEFNVNCDGESFRTFAQNARRPIFYSPYETGASVLSGFPGDGAGSREENPVFIAYRAYLSAMRREKTYQNASYDLTAVHFAFEGEGPYYRLSAPGKMLCDPLTNETIFKTEEGTDFCLELDCHPDVLGACFSAVLQRA